MEMTGRTLNHYKILAPLGKGGMGEVYAAEDLKLSRQVALKVLPERLAGNPDRRMRFEREAKAVAALNHPNIVTIYSVEEAEGIHFLTMEMVKGRTLSELIPKGGLSLERLLTFAVAMADAVGSAHKKGIIHRDLKPDNVLVGEEGRLKVLDFGLAKLRAEAAEATSATQLPTEAETQEGKILGTVSYMSPEQAEGKPVDARSDIFSLGVLLYQMSTGQRPFQGDTPISTISSILRDTPDSILELNQTLPRHLGRIVNRCLAKDPDRRYQTAIDLRNDLEVLEGEVHSGEAMAEIPVPQRPGSRNVWLVVGLSMAIVAAVALGYWFSRFAGRGESRGPSAFEGMRMVRLTTTGDSSEAAISPDGRYVAYVKEGPQGDSLWLRQVSAPSSVEIVPAEEGILYDPTFSPEGDAIYYIRREAGSETPVLFRVPTLGGPSIKVLENVSERVSFSPDGDRFVFLRFFEDGSTSLMTADRNGGDLRTLTRRHQPDEFVGEPVWSPDGAIVATPVVRWTGRMEHSLLSVSSQSGEERPIPSPGWGGIGEIAWLPDGSGLVIEARVRGAGLDQLWEIGYPDGGSRRITNDLNSYDGVGLTSDGTALVSVQIETSKDIWIAPREDPGQAVRVGPGDPFQMSWLPDGRIVHTRNTGGNQEIWITAEDGTASQITFDSHDDYDPVVCLGYIVFVSNRGDSHNLWRMDPDGGNTIRLTSGDGEFLPQCRGESVIFEAQGPSLLMIAEVPIDGGEMTVLGEGKSYGWWTLELSPDRTKLAYLVKEEGTERWVPEILDLETREATRIPDASLRYLSMLRWSPDGNTLLYSENENGVGNIWSIPPEGGSSPEKLTDFEDKAIQSFAWSPDGLKLALLRVTRSSDIVLLENFR